MRSAGDAGISAGELVDRVQSSRQTVYAWMKKPEVAGHLRVVGKSTLGGTLYKWVEKSPARRVADGMSQPSASDADSVEVGSVFTVTRLRFVGGRMVATLTGPNAEVEAELS